MWPLRQSTASQEIPLGPFLDSTDGNTQETGLTIANTDIKLFKAGATSEVSKNSGGATHIANGRYYTVLDATDTDTVGPVRVMVHVSGALAVWLDCMVYEEVVYDALFAASAAGYQVPIWASAGSTVNLSATTIKTATDVETDTQDIQSRLPAALGANGNIKADVRDFNGVAGTSSGGRPEVNTTHAAGTTWGSGAITASAFAPGAIDASAIAADAIGSSELAASAASEIATAVRTELTTELARVDVAVSTRLASAGYTAPLDAAGVRSAVGLASANLDTQLTAIDDYLDTEIAAIKAKTDALPADPADASDIAASFATVNSTLSTIAGYIDTEVAAIYNRIGAPSGASIAADIAAVKADSASILDDTGTSGVVVASGSKSGYSLSSSGMDAVVIETGLNARQSMSLIVAALSGVLSGAATTTITIKGAGVATTRIVATVDADGNRSALTLSPPA